MLKKSDATRWSMRQCREHSRSVTRLDSLKNQGGWKDEGEKEKKMLRRKVTEGSGGDSNAEDE